MKSIHMSFSLMLRQMKQDIMLITIAFIPLLAGVIFRFVIPIVEDFLTGYLRVSAILSPYYELFDLFLIIITPAMLNYVAAMVVLEETDDRLVSYLAVTPLGKSGYLFSRLGIISLIALPISIVVFLLFHLSQINIFMMIGIAIAGVIQGMVVALLIISLSTNKVEGLAVGKMSSLFTLGALAPYFITGKTQYFLSFLPSFWIAKAIQLIDYLSLVISILLAMLWLALLSKRFMIKIRS